MPLAVRGGSHQLHGGGGQGGGAVTVAIVRLINQESIGSGAHNAEGGGGIVGFAQAGGFDPGGEGVLAVLLHRHGEGVPLGDGDRAAVKIQALATLGGGRVLYHRYVAADEGRGVPLGAVGRLEATVVNQISTCHGAVHRGAVRREIGLYLGLVAAHRGYHQIVHIAGGATVAAGTELQRNGVEIAAVEGVRNLLPIGQTVATRRRGEGFIRVAVGAGIGVGPLIGVDMVQLIARGGLIAVVERHGDGGVFAHGNRLHRRLSISRGSGELERILAVTINGGVHRTLVDRPTVGVAHLQVAVDRQIVRGNHRRRCGQQQSAQQAEGYNG